jgi:hypothetical protein
MFLVVHPGLSLGIRGDYVTQAGVANGVPLREILNAEFLFICVLASLHESIRNLEKKECLTQSR